MVVKRYFLLENGLENKHDMSISNNSARRNGKVGLFGSYCRARKLKLIGRKISGSKFS